MKHIKYLFAALIVLTLAGCGTVSRDQAYGPTVNRFYMSDLEYVGETEVEISYSRYLIFFRKIHTLNNETYDSSKKKYAYLDCDGKLTGLQKASYKAIEEFPEGRYFQVVRRTKVQTRLFLGSEVQEKAIIRVYKYKN